MNQAEFEQVDREHHVRFGMAVEDTVISKSGRVELALNQLASVQTILTGFELTVETGTVNPDFPFSQPNQFKPIRPNRFVNSPKVDATLIFHFDRFEPIVEPGTANPDFPFSQPNRFKPI